jgi:hypothetical protein
MGKHNFRTPSFYEIQTWETLFEYCCYDASGPELRVLPFSTGKFLEYLVINFEAMIKIESHRSIQRIDRLGDGYVVYVKKSLEAQYDVNCNIALRMKFYASRD